MNRDFDDDKFRIEPLEKDKKGKEPFEAPLYATMQEFFLCMLCDIKKFLSTLPMNTSSSPTDTEEFLTHSPSLKDLFLCLMHEDVSHDVTFIENLSSAWKELTTSREALQDQRKNRSSHSHEAQLFPQHPLPFSSRRRAFTRLLSGCLCGKRMDPLSPSKHAAKTPPRTPCKAGSLHPYQLDQPAFESQLAVQQR